MGKRLTHGSLFAGIGGFDLGFERAGFKTVWQVEKDARCRKVLAEKFPDADRSITDVNKAGASNLSAVSVVAGGFPCQDLSHCQNGRRSGLAGARSGLFYEMARVVSELKPRWVVAENVTGLLSAGDGFDFRIVISTLAELGYCVGWRVLNSAYFGVAQKRRRVFIVGSLGTSCAARVLFGDVGQDLESVSDEAPPESVVPVVIKTHNTGGNGVGISRYAHTLDSRPDRVVLAPFDRNGVGAAWGISEKLDAARHRQIGNAVVPQIAEWIARRILGVSLEKLSGA